MANWIPGQGFYLVQSSTEKEQKKTDLEVLEIRLQEAEIRLGVRNG